MQNDMLKNNIAPWQEKGRWYHGVWDIENAVFLTNETDPELLSNDYAFSMITNTEFIRPTVDNKKILDAKTLYRSPLSIGSNQTVFEGSHRVFTAGVCGIGFCVGGSGHKGFADVWFFIVND